jgi:NAD(P)-dependent dehydrogenase (short-subunit alcohol dehydrogenase family)
VARLEGKVAIVTGGAGGIGRATALALAREGACVLVADVDADRNQGVVDEIVSEGGRASGAVVDVSVEDQVRGMVDAAVDTFGGLDVLHNNAALTTATRTWFDGAITEVQVEEWDQAMNVNVRGPMFGCKHAIPRMIERGGGSIVNTSSGASIRGDRGLTAYAASKAALNALTLSVATQYGKEGIRCNAVLPGQILTQRSGSSRDPERRDVMLRNTLTPYLGEPEEIANAVVFLASDESRFVTGQLLPVDGGLTSHLPQYAFTKGFLEPAEP